MARKTQRQFTAALRAARVATPGLQATFRAEGDKKLAFKGFITIDGVEFEAAANNGKIQVFRDIDAFVKYAAACVENPTGTYEVSIETGVFLVDSVPADVQKWAAAEIVRLGTKKTAQEAVLAGLDGQLALIVGWESGNQLQQAKKAETTAQKTAVQGDVAEIDAEITRLTALL